MSAAATAPLLSAQWFRVAALRPRLDPQAQVERISYRRQHWYVLVRADGSRSFRLNAAAYAFAARCDGKLSVQRLWDLLLGEFKDDAPTQDELLHLLVRLHGSALLAFDRKPDFGPQGTLAEPAAAAATAGGTKNSLLSFRIPLGHPDRWLGVLAPHLSGLFTPTVLLVWTVAVLLGAAAALLNAGLLAAYAKVWLATPRLLLLVWMAYPVVKALHELAHALALKHFGAKVPEWGVTLMMFTPVPYVDASAATALPAPRQRLLVSAAGIMVELLLAAIALLIGLNVEAGWLRDAAFAVFFIGSVSTLLVNGNPLLRFDGYHMLGDALELPNLATRSARHWTEWLRQHLLGVEGGGALQPAAGEAAWLWGYAPAALAYRLLISVALIAWLGGISFLLGTAIALYFVWTLAGQPLLRLLSWSGGASLAELQRRRARQRLALLAAGALAALALLPLPYASVAQGVVWLPEHAVLRTGTAGFVERIHVADGERVRAGQLLFTLNAPALAADLARLDGRITALETERFQVLRSDPSRAVGLEHELAGANAELARSVERQQQLELRAGVDGVITIPHAADLPGRFVKQGTLLAQVLTGEPTTVRVAIAQELAPLVQNTTRSVGVRFSEAGGEVWSATWLPDSAAAVARLPSAALAERSGGSIVTDPADKAGLTPVQAVMLADVQVAERPAQRVGGRAWVRFDHGWSPLAMQAARRVQQLFLKHFNPAQ